jgi:hypothetical protein
MNTSSVVGATFYLLLLPEGFLWYPESQSENRNTVTVVAGLFWYRLARGTSAHNFPEKARRDTEMEGFFFRSGKYLRIPILDPGNVSYVSRIELIVSLISGLVEKWESFYDVETSEVPQEMEQISYSIRRLAESLSSEEITHLEKQDFMVYARDIAGNFSSGGTDRKKMQRAMRVICEGLGHVQSSLDYGYPAFVDPSPECMEPLIELVPVPSSAHDGDCSQKTLQFGVEEEWDFSPLSILCAREG